MTAYDMSLGTYLVKGWVGWGNFFNQTVHSRLRVVVVWSEQEKYGRLIFFCHFGGSGGGSTTQVPWVVKPE